MANMSFMLTKEACRQYLKTVTRRKASTWKRLKPLDRLQQVEQGQGLQRGDKVKPIHKIIVLGIETEPLRRLTDDPKYGRREMILEGFPHFEPESFVSMFCNADHCTPEELVKRIDFRYLLPMDGGQIIQIPKSVAVCPACETGITISPDGWIETEDGIFRCDSFTRWCATEPDLQDRAKYNAWENSHYQVNNMPYVYWLPVEYKIESWLNNTFRFEE